MKRIYTISFVLLIILIADQSLAQSAGDASGKNLDYKSIITIVDLNQTNDDKNSDPLVSAPEEPLQTIEGRKVNVDSNGIQSLAVPAVAKSEDNAIENEKPSPRK